ncbi:MAG: TPM domain-containing protein [Candidatus Yanofskybacteria bacterium]|nr:TPM domain-containing protein [Candidatus Yanofskybacteria bacterium]
MRRLLAVVAFAAALTAAAEDQLPRPAGYVTDTAGLLSTAAVTRIDEQLRAFDAQTSTQVVVVTVLSLNGEAPEAYANRLFRQWGVGQKGTNNGVLLLITKTDRKIRIEVGRGLEGALPDATAKEIIDTIIAPHLAKREFDVGVGAGVDAILAAVKGEYTRPPSTGWPTWLIVLIIVVVVLLILIVLAAGNSSGGGGYYASGGSDWGGSSGGGGGGGWSGGGGDSGGGGASGGY